MRILFTTLAIFLSGCAAPPQRVSVDRKVYHTIANVSQLSGKTYTIEYVKPEQADSLEIQEHARLLSTFISKLGMKPASKELSNADYVFRIKFGIGKENMLGGSSTSSASITAIGTSVTSSSSLYTRTEYTRSFDITIHEGNKLRAGNKVPIYEGLALSEDASNDTTRHFPVLIDALMYDFPSKSGEMQRGVEFELW